LFFDLKFRIIGNDRDRRDSTCLFIGNLPYHFREKETAEYFERCGRLRNVSVGMNRKTGQSKGYAFVEYEDRRDAEDAFER
jgi:RNA recognition motif-containing protein